MLKPTSIQQIARSMRGGQKARLIAEPEEGQVADLPYNTQTYVFSTAVNQSELLYTASGWVTIKLTLNSAGPVVVSTSQDVLPVLSGRGIPLVTGVERAITLPRGNRLFIGAAALNSVSVVIEPLPWLQSLAISVDKNTRSIVNAISQAVRSVVPGARPGPGPGSSPGTENGVPCPPPRRPFFPKGKR